MIRKGRVKNVLDIKLNCQIFRLGERFNLVTDLTYILNIAENFPSKDLTTD